MRLFFGIALPDEVRQQLTARLTDALGGRPLPGRPVPPDNWHITLRFLGDTAPEQLERLRSEVAAREPLGLRFELELAGYGAFPRPARASVLWLGIDGGRDPLHRLASELEAVSQGAGFAAENRSFSPHLTLSRIQPPQDVRDLLRGLQPFQSRFPVPDVVLFRSHLGNGPARYEALERYALTEREELSA